MKTETQILSNKMIEIPIEKKTREGYYILMGKKADLIMTAIESIQVDRLDTITEV